MCYYNGLKWQYRYQNLRKGLISFSLIFFEHGWHISGDKKVWRKFKSFTFQDFLTCEVMPEKQENKKQSNNLVLAEKSFDPLEIGKSNF